MEPHQRGSTGPSYSKVAQYPQLLYYSVIEVSKSKSINKYLNLKYFNNRTKAIVWRFVKREYFLGSPSTAYKRPITVQHLSQILFKIKPICCFKLKLRSRNFPFKSKQKSPFEAELNNYMIFRRTCLPKHRQFYFSQAQIKRF